DKLLDSTNAYEASLMETGVSDERKKEIYTLQRLVQDFRNFFSAYNDFFFSSTLLEHYQSEGVQYQFILSQALSNTRDGWKELTWVIAQRKLFAADLQNADTQVKALYSLFTTPKNEAPVTYFDKMYAITRSVFQSVPLIAIPFGQYYDGLFQ